MHYATSTSTSIANEIIRFFPDPSRGIECHPSVDLSGVPHTRELDVLGHPFAMIMRASELAVAVNLTPRNPQALRSGDNILGIEPYPGSGGLAFNLPGLLYNDSIRSVFNGATGYEQLDDISHVVVSTNELVDVNQRLKNRASGILDAFGFAYVPVTDPLPVLEGVNPEHDVYCIEGFINRYTDAFWGVQPPKNAPNPALISIDIFAALGLSKNRAEIQLLKNFAVPLHQRPLHVLNTARPYTGASYIRWFDAKNDTPFMPRTKPDFDALINEKPILTSAQEEMLLTMKLEQARRLA